MHKITVEIEDGEEARKYVWTMPEEEEAIPHPNWTEHGFDLILRADRIAREKSNLVSSVEPSK